MRGLFERRRGFRLMELLAVGCLIVIVLGVYLTKAAAGREGAQLADVNNQIREEERRLKVLRAELAYLEQPRRIEKLAATYLALEPLSAQREVQVSSLADISHRPVPPPKPGAAP